MTLGFFGLLRRAEFTIQSQSAFDPAKNLTINDVSLRSTDDDKNFMSVRIKSSKTDKSGKGYNVYIGCSKSEVCAVCAMSSYLVSRCKQPSQHLSEPLYVFRNGSLLTKSLLVNSTKLYLSKIGIDPDHFTAHSYRVGGATSAAEAGLSDWEIKLMGRWSRDTYQTYIKAPITTLIKFAYKTVHNKTKYKNKQTFIKNLHS